MNYSLSKKILHNNQGLICVINPAYNGEAAGEVCTIRAVNNGWINVWPSICDLPLNIRAKDLETLNTAQVLGWK